MACYKWYACRPKVYSIWRIVDAYFGLFNEEIEKHIKNNAYIRIEREREREIQNNFFQ